MLSVNYPPFPTSYGQIPADYTKKQEMGLIIVKESKDYFLMEIRRKFFEKGHAMRESESEKRSESEEERILNYPITSSPASLCNSVSVYILKSRKFRSSHGGGISVVILSLITISILLSPESFISNVKYGSVFLTFS